MSVEFKQRFGGHKSPTECERFKRPESRYFSLDFKYPGPYSNIPSSDELDLKLRMAEALVECALSDLFGKFVHQYSWTDGSLYKYVKVQGLTAEQIEEKLNQILVPFNCSVKATRVKAEHKTSSGKRLAILFL